jgi:hypothetical protein
MEKIMNTLTKVVLAAGLLSLPVIPVVAFAQSNDAAYCKALVAKYEQYLDMDSKRWQQPQSLDVRSAVEKCKAGDSAGIPVIEKALKDAKFDLPPRG